MKKTSRRRRIMLIVTAVLVAATCMPLTASAAPVKKMTTYGHVLKSGGYIYCAADYGLYKVNERKGTVKYLDRGDLAGRAFTDLVKKGNYLYARVEGPYGYGWDQLWRVNVNNGSWLQLCGSNSFLIGSYAISGNKIYTENTFHRYDTGVQRYKMDLNGKNVKKTDARVKMQRKYSNAEGYSAYSYIRGDVQFWWLKTPSNKRIFLGKHYSEEYYERQWQQDESGPPAGRSPWVQMIR